VAAAVAASAATTGGGFAESSFITADRASLARRQIPAFVAAGSFYFSF